mmetsp:Transcript_35400/g.93790  ORF Transcript_35400/g.93790 Transcript_35400/m.93790 type:complete len:251 (+) Transcript_35400:343-1095(+)
MACEGVGVPVHVELHEVWVRAVLLEEQVCVVVELGAGDVRVRVVRREVDRVIETPLNVILLALQVPERHARELGQRPRHEPGDRERAIEALRLLCGGEDRQLARPEGLESRANRTFGKEAHVRIWDHRRRLVLELLAKEQARPNLRAHRPGGVAADHERGELGLHVRLRPARGGQRVIVACLHLHLLRVKRLPVLYGVPRVEIPAAVQDLDEGVRAEAVARIRAIEHPSPVQQPPWRRKRQVKRLGASPH